MELATIFLVHCLETYGKAGARLAFVMPRSVLTADQHERLRSREYKAKVSLTALWDLFDVRPLFNVPSCVLFAERYEAVHSTVYSRGPDAPLPALVWVGDLPDRNSDWANASTRLRCEERTARVIRMGKRSAFTTSGRATSDHTSPSAYLSAFRQGATIVPRNFYFVEVDRVEHPPKPGTVRWVRTDKVQAKEAKAPYRDLSLDGNVEAEFLFRTAISKHVLPFHVLDPAWIVLPIVVEGGEIQVWQSEKFYDEGFRGFGKWMGEAETHWDRLREKKADRQSVYQRLDYQKGLRTQDLSLPFLVLYNAASYCQILWTRSDSGGVLDLDSIDELGPRDDGMEAGRAVQ